MHCWMWERPLLGWNVPCAQRPVCPSLCSLSILFMPMLTKLCRKIIAPGISPLYLLNHAAEFHFCMQYQILGDYKRFGSNSASNWVITSAIKHVKKFCAMPVVIENGDHAFIYLFAGAIIKRTYFCICYYSGIPALLTTREISFVKLHDISLGVLWRNSRTLQGH